jgi:hypothetical protein
MIEALNAGLKAIIDKRTPPRTGVIVRRFQRRDRDGIPWGACITGVQDVVLHDPQAPSEKSYVEHLSEPDLPERVAKHMTTTLIVNAVTGRRLCRSDTSGRQARRPTRAATHQIRVGDQHENREGARPHDSAIATGPSGQDHPVAMLDQRGQSSGQQSDSPPAPCPPSTMHSGRCEPGSTPGRASATSLSACTARASIFS